MADDGELVALGVVARPHGVGGELRVHPFNPASDLLATQEVVTLRGTDGETRPARVEGVRRQKDALLFRLEGVVGREAADALRGTELCVPRDRFPEPGEDEVYHVDLVDLAVVDAGGRAVGTVAEVLDYPSVDCLRVVDADGEGEWEVPLLERFVPEIDLEAGRVVVAFLDELPRARVRRRR